ncbi:beta-lactamase [Rhodonellum psychrophilum GCM71 = DSM 17998]|uniref:Beta-lactamase n=2 Tax=Rhodonellum TaxID=336827 RepID=U5BIR1_9BACT|nr:MULTISPECIES: serine hydrolase domain-containing protein [Rhodonellum]ERM80295.1 beta-lactamase [Rhodonellum psychrophilum GCM71 = DSM 17998]SDZ21208.1 CubicO group peptidase, beta-lactamase class C family [Rhodonellum ikkaensis]
MRTSLKFLAALLVSNFSYGQDISKKIDSIINANHQKNPDVSISVGFVSNNAEYFTAYGNLSKDSQTKVDKNTLFEIASITKILTSNLIAQAVIENKIELEDYIDNYLPKAYVLNKNLKNKIKISDLASHQSGLPDIDFAKLIEIDPQQPVSSITEEKLTTIINNCTELKDYGKYRYSTIGYTLLGLILEKVYGKSYDKIIKSNIINPLKMTNTLTINFDVKNKVVGYNPDGGAQELFNWNITAPSGLIKSNASDMVKYLKAVLNNETAIGKAAMMTEEIFYKDEKRELGLGTNIMTDEKNTLYQKSGDLMGQSSLICYNRAKNWGIIILINQRNSEIRNKLLNEIYNTILK